MQLLVSPPQTQGYVVDWSVNMKSYFMHITEDMKWIWCSRFWTVGQENLVLHFWTVSLLTHTFTDQWQEFTSPVCCSISSLEFTCLAPEVHRLLLSDKATENCFQWHHVVYILPKELFLFEGCLLNFTSIVWHVTTDCGNLKCTVWCCFQWHNVCIEFHKDVGLFLKLMWETHGQLNDLN